MTSPSPEQLPLSPIPDLSTVLGAYNDIFEHNRTRTALGAHLRRMAEYIGGTAARAEAGASGMESAAALRGSVGRNVVEEGDMGAALQDVLHGDTFALIGVKVAPFGHFGTGRKGQAITSAELVPLIVNTSLFVEFLGTLQPTDVLGEDAERFLSDIVAILAERTDFCFDTRRQQSLSEEEKEQPIRDGEDALRTFDTLDEEYVRLGVDGASMRKRLGGISQELSGYLNGSGPSAGVVPAGLRGEHRAYIKTQDRIRVYEGMKKRVLYWGRNLLPEYIRAEKKQYLTPPSEQTFGPVNWHEDGGQYHWQEAFDFLQELEQGERTKPFAAEVSAGLVASLDAALAGLDGGSWRDQRNNLVNIRNALSGRLFDEAKLAAYVKPTT